MDSELGLPREDLLHAGSIVGAGAWHSLDGARVLVTGGTGFVGTWLLATALRATRTAGIRTEFVILSRNPPAFLVAHPRLAKAPGVRLVAGDVRDFDFPSGSISHVVHAATDVAGRVSARETFDVIVRGTQRVLRCAEAKGASELLLVSSGAVYGQQPATMGAIPETYLGAPSLARPASAYAEGKRVSEWLTHLSVADGLAPRVARCFALVGPRLPLHGDFAIGNFMADALAGRSVEVTGDGTALRSYLHAADVSGWLWAMLLRGQPGATYNVGGEEAVSIADLAHLVNRVAGSTAGVRIAMPSGPATPLSYVPDVSLIRRELAVPDPLPLEEAIRRTVDWHRRTSLPAQ